MTSKQKLVWRTEKRRVNDLLPYERNPRSMTDKQLEDLKKSLKKFNLVEIPVINIDGKIAAGHMRIRAMQLLGRGEEQIEVRIPNRLLSKQEFEQYLISSNAISGSWDFEKLQGFEIDLLLDAGMDESTLAHIWDSQLETEDDGWDTEKELAKIKKAKTKLGQVIQLGPHKLICGDATDKSVIKKLVGKEHASMIYVDPVFNINFPYDKGLGGKQNYGGNVNDNRSETEYKSFLKKAMEASLAVTKDDAHVFYYCDQNYIGMVQQLYHELGITNRRVCLWIKNGFNPTPGIAFNKCYEPCVYGTIGKPYLAKGIENLNEIQNKEITTGNRVIEEILDMLDIWLVKRLSGTEYEHATQKPPTLHEKAIRRCTRPGDIILDSMAGSGSTMVAAEQLKRRAFLCELEPIFCDLIIKRYEKLTNKKAKYLN